MGTNYRLSKALGFDTSAEQGGVRPENVNFSVGKTPRMSLWAGGYCHNGIFFYANSPEIIWESIRRAGHLATQQHKSRVTAKQTKIKPKTYYRESGFRESGQVVLYDMNGKFEVEGKRLDKIRSGFAYRQPKSILHLLTDIQEFRLRTKEYYSKLPYGAVNRKVTLAFLHMESDALAELKRNTKAFQVLLDIFINGHNERFMLLLVTNHASMTPRELIDVADMGWYLDDENEKFAEKHYGLPIYRKHFGEVHRGLVWEKGHPEVLTSFTSLVKEVSEWLKKKKETLDAEDLEWEEYLKALDAERE